MSILFKRKVFEVYFFHVIDITFAFLGFQSFHILVNIIELITVDLNNLQLSISSTIFNPT